MNMEFLLECIYYMAMNFYLPTFLNVRLIPFQTTPLITNHDFL
jgi:hypothetical protein